MKLFRTVSLSSLCSFHIPWISLWHSHCQPGSIQAWTWSVFAPAYCPPAKALSNLEQSLHVAIRALSASREQLMGFVKHQWQFLQLVLPGHVRLSVHISNKLGAKVMTLEQFATIDLVDIGIYLTESTWTVNLYLINLYTVLQQWIFLYNLSLTHSHPDKSFKCKFICIESTTCLHCFFSASFLNFYTLSSHHGYWILNHNGLKSMQKSKGLISHPHEIADWHHYWLFTYCMTILSNISISTSPFCASPVLLHLHEASHGTLATEFGDATEAETQKENANGSTWWLSKTGSGMVWYGLMCLCVRKFCSCFIFQCVERRNSLISMIL